jgi:hypothetical protein
MSTVVAPTYVPLFLTELVCPSCATTCMHMHGPRARPRTLRAKIDSTTTTDFTLDVSATACWCIPLPSDVVPRYRDGSINRHGRAARAWHEPAEASAGARPTASAAAEPPASAVRTARKPERKGKRPRRQHVKRSKAKTKPHKNRRQRQNREPPN